MAVDTVELSLSPSSTLVNKGSMPTLTATALTKEATVLTDVTHVEFLLMFSPFGESGLKQPVKTNKVTVPASTGTYETSFAPSEFANPGFYQVLARAIVQSGSPIVVSVFETALSAEIEVREVGGADSLNNILNDKDFSAVTGKSFVFYQKVSLTGAKIKEIVADSSLQASDGKIFDLPSGSLVLGGNFKASVATATAGAVMHTGASAGANDVIANGAIDATTAVNVAATFVPILAATNEMKIKVDMGAGKTIDADLEDNFAVDVYFAYVVPAALIL